jgi:hypothetical protein
MRMKQAAVRSARSRGMAHPMGIMGQPGKSDNTRRQPISARAANRCMDQVYGPGQCASENAYLLRAS